MSLATAQGIIGLHSVPYPVLNHRSHVIMKKKDRAMELVLREATYSLLGLNSHSILKTLQSCYSVYG